MAKVSLRAYNREIEAMIDRGQLDEAIAHCQHILKTFPKHLETYRLLGKAFLEYKRYKDAVDIFSRVLVVEPNDFVANVGMSIIRDEEDKFDDAIWHMERAFEVQPSNAAIQGELQRLYGRREGVQPPRIRMTRGALAHMYVQGELYPQAISEIKSVLADDAGRTDMQVLMARAYYRSGQKNEAADTASAVLRRYPYSLDANRILVEILGTDRPENSQLYRQRVIELDPYAGQVSGSIFQANEVGDAAVTLDHLEWSGQPATMQSDWETTKAISLESGRGPEAQPDWLRSGGFTDETPLQPTPKVVPPLPASTPTFDMPASTPSFASEPEPVPAEPTPEADIPDFLRAAGWGQSTGEFDESKSMFADEPAAPTPASDVLPIEQGNMPDWLKAMAPPQVTEPAQSLDQAQGGPAEEEPLPDWINKIGTGALSTAAVAAASDEFDWLNPADESSQPQAQASDDQPDWMKQFDQPASSQSATGDQPDWMKGFGDEPASTPVLPADEPAQPATPVSSDEQPDWMKQLDQPAASESTEQPDWMKQFDQPTAQTPATNDQTDWLAGVGNEPTSTPASEDQPDWMKQLDQPASSQSVTGDQPDWMKGFGDEPAFTPALPADDQPDWMKQLANQSTESAPASSMPDEFDFLNELTAPASQPSAPAAMDTVDLGNSQSEIDDSLAWLENLAAKQGATEGLLVKPEDRMDKEPDWVAKIKGTTQTPTPEPLQPVAPVQPTVVQPPVSESQQPAVNVADPGTSQSEIDDSLAWLENLAAKQGATEGLLVKPEDRMDKEPDWVAKIKGTSQPPAPQPPAQESQQPVANVEDLGKSQTEIDDSLAWLENLAAKQGATEGLLVKPEDRMDKEPDWVAKIKGTSQPPAPQPPAQESQQPVANVEELGKSQTEIDDSLAWLENLAAKQGATEGLLVKPEDRMDKEPDWVQQVKGAPQASVQPPAANMEDLGKSQSEIDDSLAWLENLAAKQGATEGLLVKPEDRMDKEPDWVQQVKGTPQAPVQPPAGNVEDLGKSQSEIDDSLAWLENLAAKQGATEGLLIKPEDRMEKEPDWVQQVKKGTGELKSKPAEQQSEIQPSANIEDLGKSQSDIDDSLAWMENLAAKQGATEGLLIKPEDRMEKEPDWVQQVKSTPEVPAQQPSANVEDLGKSQSEIDDSLAWLENLAAKQGATEGLLVKPEDRMEKEPDWVQQVKSTPQVPAEPVTFEQQSVDDTAAWLSSLDEEESKPEPVSTNDDTAMWLKSLDEPEPAPISQADDIPAWLQGIDEEQAPVAEAAVPAASPEPVAESDWMNEIEEQAPISAPVSSDENIPSWLKGIDEEEARLSTSLPQDDLPAWMRDETGEVVAEPTKIEPTRSTDWHPINEKQPEPPAPQPIVREQPEPVVPVQEKPKSAPVKKAAPKPAEAKPATPPTPYREPLTQRGTGMLTMPTDPILGSARSELSRSNIPGALETYSKLIKKGRFLDEVIFDLREALYRYPVEVSIWQSLGDAYMRANRLQDALDAYTKAEELLR